MFKIISTLNKIDLMRSYIVPAIMTAAMFILPAFITSCSRDNKNGENENAQFKAPSMATDSQGRSRTQDPKKNMDYSNSNDNTAAGNQDKPRTDNGGSVKANTETFKKEDLVRSGTIDVKALDVNKDGKLYECSMDWNVISDHPSQCPICKMDLREYTDDQVARNLRINHFKVK